MRILSKSNLNFSFFATGMEITFIHTIKFLIPYYRNGGHSFTNSNSSFYITGMEITFIHSLGFLNRNGDHINTQIQVPRSSLPTFFIYLSLQFFFQDQIQIAHFVLQEWRSHSYQLPGHVPSPA